MNRPVRNIVIVGGGTAGWLAACAIAARLDRSVPDPITVILVESPDLPTIGVGEGTWPTMRRTLSAIGIDEAEFLLACNASFKQGSRFDGWRTGDAGDSYYHPFAPPPEAGARALVDAWAATGEPRFDSVSSQPRVCDAALAPRQPAMPGYAGALNYAYHLDAAKLAALLTRHATERLGVRHLRDHVEGAVRDPDGDIAAIVLREHGALAGDLFVDCSGHAARLIGGEMDVPFVSRGDVLFNDRAMAVQVPVAPDSAIASATIATAHPAGWLWDIGLPTRRGIGCVYASGFMSDDAAMETLRHYVAAAIPTADIDTLAPRKLAFRSGYRARFWERNCLAIGLAAGFLEPLEASAIVLVELSLEALLDGFPATREVMDIHAARFNALFRYRWDRIVEFLKLHYVLSERDEPYWRAHRDSTTVPERLRDLLFLWRHQPPSATDFAMLDEVFPAASHQFVLYGMGFPAPEDHPIAAPAMASAGRLIEQAQQRGRVLASSLPTNRAYLDALVAGQAPLRTGAAI